MNESKFVTTFIIAGIMLICLLFSYIYAVEVSTPPETKQPIDYYYEGYQDGLAATWKGNTIYDHVNADIYEIGYHRGLNKYIAEQVYTK